MSDVAIRVEGLSKKYRLGGSKAAYSTLRDQIGQWALKPFKKAASDAPETRKESFWALKDVSFEIKRGEVIGVIGRNGAGKSTLLKILSRITEPTEGSADVFGRVGSLLEVGTGFNPELTGRENTFLNGAILGMRKSEILRKFDEIVAFAEVEKFIDTPVKHYSSGMYMRLAFSIAAHLEPEILIVDEVLAVGDSTFQTKCLGKMGEVAKGGRTVLFVSHNAQAIHRLTHRCIYLRQGTKVDDGRTGDVMLRYTKEGSLGSGAGSYVSTAQNPRKNHIAQARVETSEGDGLHHWGKPATFHFDIAVLEPSTSICFSFQIVNHQEVAVCHFSSFNPSAGWGSTPGVYSLSCSIPKLRLFMGNYTLTTWLSERRTNEIVENLQNICNFKVEMVGTDRGQYEWRLNDCVYLEDCSWRLLTSTGLSSSI